MGRWEATGAFAGVAGYGEDEVVCDRPEGEPGEKAGKESVVLDSALELALVPLELPRQFCGVFISLTLALGVLKLQFNWCKRPLVSVFVFTLSR